MIGIMVLTTMVACLIAFVIFVILDESSIPSEICKKIGIASGIALSILFIIITIQVGNVELEKNLAWFQETKTTYNASLEDEKITGFERVEITNTAIKANRELAKAKIDIVQWWNAPYDNDLVDKMLEQTPIGTEVTK